MERDTALNILCHECGNFISSFHHKKYCKIKYDLKCSLCDKQFSKLKYLLQHKNTHLQNSFLCEYCSKSFSRKQNLLKHINTIHFKQSIDFWICMVCESTFKTKWNLKEHENIHKPKTFPCSICPKIFHEERNKNDHERRCRLKHKL